MEQTLIIINSGENRQYQHYFRHLAQFICDAKHLLTLKVLTNSLSMTYFIQSTSQMLYNAGDIINLFSYRKGAKHEMLIGKPRKPVRL